MSLYTLFFLVTYTQPDPSAIANQESLSGLEVEMRKLEGLVKELVDEMGYLKAREERFSDTNCQYSFWSSFHIF
jgi:emp24/gp25L/p24 family/GOLD